jgi:NAD(P)-dependent dehydrogenase (short-subunit alcohol dehydrogenase family)
MLLDGARLDAAAGLAALLFLRLAFGSFFSAGLMLSLWFLARLWRAWLRSRAWEMANMAAFERETAQPLKIIITGASSGIGAAMAIDFAKRIPCEIALIARRRERLEEVRKQVTAPGMKCSRCAVVVADLSSGAAGCEKAIEEAMEKLGGDHLDIIVANAGVGQAFYIEQALSRGDTLPELEQKLGAVVDLNLWGQVWPVTAALKYLTASPVGGRIAVMSSAGGHLPFPRQTAYNAAKHALQGFFLTLRLETYSQPLSVTMCCPGFIRTEMTTGFNALDASGENFLKDPTPEKVEAIRMPAVVPTVDSAAHDLVSGVLARSEFIMVPVWYEMFRMLFVLWPAAFERIVVRLFIKKRRGGTSGSKESTAPKKDD